MQQQQVQPQQLEQLQVQQQQVQPQDAVAQQSGICGEQQQPSGGQQATAQSSETGNPNKSIICLEDLQIMQVQALPCIHCFHKSCLDDWQQCTDKPAHLVAEDTADEAEHQIGGNGGNAQQLPDPSAPVVAELSQLLEGEHRPLSATLLIFLSCAEVLRADFRTVLTICMRKLALREIQWHAFHRVVNNLFDMNYDTGYLDPKKDQAFLEHISTLADVHNHLKRQRIINIYYG